MKKQLPALKSDAGAEAFVATADLAEYDLSGLVPMCFELKRKDSLGSGESRSRAEIDTREFCG